MTVSQKLTLGIGSIIAAVTINTIVNSVNLNAIDTLSTQTAKESVPFAVIASDAKYQSCQMQQFVTDSSLTKDDEVLKEADDAYAKFIADIEKFEVMFKSENDKEALKETTQMKEAAKELLDTGKRMKIAYAKNQQEGDKVMEELDKDTEVLAALVEKLQKIQIDEAITNSVSTMEKANLSFKVGLLFGVITLIIGIVVGFILTKGISNSISSIQSGLQSFFRFLNREADRADLIKLDSKDEFGQMAIVINDNIEKVKKGIDEDRRLIDETITVLGEFEQGDLCQRLELSVSNPALMQLKTVLNNMASNLENNIDNVLKVLEEYSHYNYLNKVDEKGLKEHILKLATGVNTLGSAVTNMLSTSLQNGLDLQGEASTLKQAVESLSTASNQQAASLEETAAAMEEMTSNVQNNVAKSNDMALMATQTDSAAREGAVLAQRTASAMTEIQSATNSINDAVAIIENIAFQTNILSLNAAVEAATAGDAGKGFAVVAQEVRNLANRSADAAKEIQELARTARIKSQGGLETSKNMMEGFALISEKIAQTDEMVRDVANASREQMAGIGQINDAVSQLDQMTQQNAKTANNVAEIANEILNKTEQFEMILSRVKFDNKEKQSCDIGMVFDTAKLKIDHINFKENNYKKLKSESSPWKVTNHHECNLGKWIDAHANESFAHTPEWNQLLAVHEKVHGGVQSLIHADFDNVSMEHFDNLSKELEKATVGVFEGLDNIKLVACSHKS